VVVKEMGQVIKDKSKQLDDPDWATMEKAIRLLNGITHTHVYLMIGEAVGMCISGGYYNRFFCEVIPRTGACSHVIEDSKSRKTKMVQINQYEAAEWAECDVVSIKIALKAAKFYALTGECDPTLTWTTY